MSLKSRSGALLLVGVVSATTVAAAQNSLVDAVKSGKRDAVRAVLEESTGVNAPAPDGTTALHWAVRGNDPELVDLLIRAGAEVNVASRYGVTPLGLAAESGNPSVVERLLKAGADPRTRTSSAGQTVLMTAARAGHTAIIKMLMAHGANPNAREDWLDQTALMWAAAENHVPVVEALLEAGADPSVSSRIYPDSELRPVEGATVSPQWISKGGMTAMHFAARQGAKDVVRLLADTRVDLEQADPDGMTALLFAAFNGHFDTAALLLERGANPNRSDTFGQSVLFLSADLNILEDLGAAIGPRGGRPKTLDWNDTSPLELAKLAVAKGADPNPKILKPLRRRVVYFGAPVEPVPEGATPLWRAARTADVEFVKFLLAAGADPKIRAADGRTPLMAAAGPELNTFYGNKYGPLIGTEEQRVAMMQLLLDAGVDVNATNSRGETALHVAVTTGQAAVVKLLVDRGAKLDAKDIDNRTPLDVAMGNDLRPRNQLWVALPVHEHVVALLRESMMAKGIRVESYVPPEPPKRVGER